MTSKTTTNTTTNCTHGRNGRHCDDCQKAAARAFWGRPVEPRVYAARHDGLLFHAVRVDRKAGDDRGGRLRWTGVSYLFNLYVWHGTHWVPCRGEYDVYTSCRSLVQAQDHVERYARGLRKAQAAREAAQATKIAAAARVADLGGVEAAEARLATLVEVEADALATLRRVEAAFNEARAAQQALAEAVALVKEG